MSEGLAVNKGVKILNISGNPLNPASAKYLSETLKVNGVMETLDISSVSLTPEGALHLSQGLKENKGLRTLDISHNMRHSDTSLHLAEALKVNDTLTTLIVHSRFRISDVIIKQLSEGLAVNKSIETLIVTGGDWSFEGLNYLVAALNSNKECALKTLNISDNNFGSRGVGDLSTLLKSNKTLTTLDITKNKLESRSYDTLLEGLKFNDTLTTLHIDESGSNVARRVEYVIECNNVYQQLNNMGEVIIGNENLRSKVDALFIGLSVADGTLFELPIELKYVTAKQFVTELKHGVSDGTLSVL